MYGTKGHIKNLTKIHREYGHESMIEEASTIPGWDVDDEGLKERWFSKVNYCSRNACQAVGCSIR